MEKLPAKQQYSKYFYFQDDEQTEIKASLIENKAEDEAKKIIEISSSQIRLFFDEVREIESIIDEGSNKEKKFKENVARIKLLKAKAWFNYQKLIKKKDTKLPFQFVKFLCEAIDHVNNAKEFKAFVMYFEAVVGFSKVSK